MRVIYCLLTNYFNHDLIRIKKAFDKFNAYNFQKFDIVLLGNNKTIYTNLFNVDEGAVSMPRTEFNQELKSLLNSMEFEDVEFIINYCL